MPACVDSVNTGLDAHRDHLSRVCRVCGGRIATTKTSHPCQGYNILFQDLLSIDLDNDDGDIHPQSMCHTCYCLLVLSKKARRTVAIWERHPRVGTCSVCHQAVEKRKGGHPKKVTKNLAENLKKSKMEDRTTCTPQVIDTNKYSVTITCTQCSQVVPASSISQHTCSNTVVALHDHQYHKKEKTHANDLSPTQKEAIAVEVFKEKLAKSTNKAAILKDGNFGQVMQSFLLQLYKLVHVLSQYKL